ncbi:MAG: RCC1 domain-containing protein [Streptosporangiaceae bacterium]
MTTRLGGTSAAGPADEYTYLAKGSVLGWGDGYGELGNGQTANSELPVAAHLPAGTVVTATAMAMDTTYALTSAGKVYAWGYGGDGELGNGASANSATPVKVSIPSGVTVSELGTIGYGGLVRTSAGHLLAWGFGEYGELGDGSLDSSDVPVPVSLPAGTRAKAVSAGAYDGYALTTAGAVLAWGYGSDGELGNGTTETDSDVPVPVSCRGNHGDRPVRRVLRRAGPHFGREAAGLGVRRVRRPRQRVHDQQ